MKKTAQLLKGQPFADQIRVQLKKELAALRKKVNKTPRLVAIQIGDHAATSVYCKAQKKEAALLEIDFVEKQLPIDVAQRQAEAIIDGFNHDDTTAMMIHFPLPKHIDAQRLIAAMHPLKDAEGIHPYNLGNLVMGHETLVPCTAAACMALLRQTKIDLYGREVVVIGHSGIVGKPLSLLLLSQFATTTICHIATDKRGNLESHVNRAEVLIVAVGKAGLIKGEWIKKGAVVIDVGINKVEGGIVGDVEFDAAAKRASCITPVPGGVGPLTTMMLMKNTVAAFKAQHNA